ncbi:MAG: hypothetical protein H0T92_07985 [Pyrinomonadaceae bacterium]|nr:hypothetical protein [Pyrinomonadaceae bacterium]
MTAGGTADRSRQSVRLTERSELRQQVEDVFNKILVIDIHTHLFAPEFGEMNLFGIDELPLPHR